MENKYYTPKIEEFYVGFEYQVLYRNVDSQWWVDKNWKTNDSVHNFFNLQVPRSYNIPSSVRVKYLDKEDIESLGFKQNLNEHKLVKFPVFEKECKYGLLKLYFSTEIKDIRISIINLNKNETNIFIGECKNKSELKKLLKQLNIE